MTEVESGVRGCVRARPILGAGLCSDLVSFTFTCRKCSIVEPVCVSHAMDTGMRHYIDVLLSLALSGVKKKEACELACGLGDYEIAFVPGSF
ncbi:MAG: hypothetical protein KF761_05415 [Salinibacterium sp.]|nr:hypothetical protein [Salinibacterium sp.]